MSSPDLPVRRPSRPAGRAAAEFDVDQPFDVDGLYTLRETLTAHASRLGADDDQIDHLLIVAGELASNAIRHGGGAGRLRLWHDDYVLYCQVTDHGPGIADPMLGTSMPDPADGDGGRGLWICRRLTSRFTIETTDDAPGTTVTAEIPSQDGNRSTDQ